jgi:transcriptional regulator GlxA family with amidase domain
MPARTKVVAFLVGSPADLINLIAISTVFSYPRVDGKSVYATKILSSQRTKVVQGSGGITLADCIPYSEYTGPIDTLVVVGGISAFDEVSPDLIQWVRKRASQTRPLVSVCTGAFVLAPTGLLDGKRVTTHWHHAAKLAQLFPKLKVDKDKIFHKDGKVYSTAGVTAGIDLALSIIGEDLGHQQVAAIAHTMVLYVRRAGHESQYSTLLAQQADVCGTRLRDLPAWAQSRLTQKLDVNTMANAVAMTPRTFARQFELHFNTTPARWVQKIRVEAACVYLTTDSLPVKAIATLTGFRDELSLRRAFSQQLMTTPKDYRRRFGMARHGFQSAELHSAAP